MKKAQVPHIHNRTKTQRYEENARTIAWQMLLYEANNVGTGHDRIENVGPTTETKNCCAHVKVCLCHHKSVKS